MLGVCGGAWETDYTLTAAEELFELLKLSEVPIDKPLFKVVSFANLIVLS